MKSNRSISFVNAIYRLGFIQTLQIIIQFFFIKTGIKKYIRAGGFNRLYIRRKSSDFAVFRQIFMDGEYDIYIPFQPKVIIDLGANIGLFSLLMNQLFPEATIYSIEPENSNFQQLTLNTMDVSKIQVFKIAIWNEIGTVTIDSGDSQGGEWGASVTNSSITKSSHEVDSITLSKFLNLNNITRVDILKIDIEGAEKELFSSDTEWISIVKMIIIELHDNIKPGSSQNFIRALGQLDNISFSISGENIIVINEAI